MSLPQEEHLEFHEFMCQWIYRTEWSQTYRWQEVIENDKMTDYISYLYLNGIVETIDRSSVTGTSISSFQLSEEGRQLRDDYREFYEL